MRRTLLIVISVCLISGSLFAQEGGDLINLEPLAADLNTMFYELGAEIMPYLHQNAFSGDIVGEAELGNAPHFSLSLIGVGATVFPGLLNFLDEADWKFEFMRIPDLLDIAFAASPDIKDFIQTRMALPGIRMGLGIGIFGGFEIFANGFFFNQAITDMIVQSLLPMLGLNLADDPMMGPLIDGFSLDTMNLNVKLRRVFLKDQGLIPAISLGLGYTYSHFSMEMTIPTLDTILEEPVEIPGFGNLDVAGKFGIDTLVHSIGLDFHISKRLILFTPFLIVSPRYQWMSQFTTNLQFNAFIKDTDGNTVTEISIDKNPELSMQDLNVFITAGLELKLLILVISPSVTLNLETPLLDFEKLMFNGVSANVGIRVQI